MCCLSSSKGTAEKDCFAVLQIVTVHDKVAWHAGMEDVNQATIAIRNGQAVLAGPMVRQI